MAVPNYAELTLCPASETVVRNVSVGPREGVLVRWRSSPTGAGRHAKHLSDGFTEPGANGDPDPPRRQDGSDLERPQSRDDHSR